MKSPSGGESASGCPYGSHVIGDEASRAPAFTAREQRGRKCLARHAAWRASRERAAGGGEVTFQRNVKAEPGFESGSAVSDVVAAWAKA